MLLDLHLTGIVEVERGLAHTAHESSQRGDDGRGTHEAAGEALQAACGVTMMMY
jgi:hypothetical protein